MRFATHLIITLVLATACLAQQPSQAPAQAPGAPAQAPAVEVLTPKDASSTLTLELATERGINIQYQINDIVVRANKEVQDRVSKEAAPLQEKQAKEALIMAEEVKKIKLANHWGDDVNWDINTKQFVRKPVTQTTPSQSNQPSQPIKK